jgi:hypothetical protein
MTDTTSGDKKTVLWLGAHDGVDRDAAGFRRTAGYSDSASRPAWRLVSSPVEPSQRTVSANVSRSGRG